MPATTSLTSHEKASEQNGRQNLADFVFNQDAEIPPALRPFSIERIASYGDQIQNFNLLMKAACELGKRIFADTPTTLQDYLRDIIGRSPFNAPTVPSSVLYGRANYEVHKGLKEGLFGMFVDVHMPQLRLSQELPQLLGRSGCKLRMVENGAEVPLNTIKLTFSSEGPGAIVIKSTVGQMYEGTSLTQGRRWRRDGSQDSANKALYELIDPTGQVISEEIATMVLWLHVTAISGLKRQGLGTPAFEVLSKTGPDDDFTAQAHLIRVLGHLRNAHGLDFSNYFSDLVVQARQRICLETNACTIFTVLRLANEVQDHKDLFVRAEMLTAGYRDRLLLGETGLDRDATFTYLRPIASFSREVVNHAAELVHFYGLEVLKELASQFEDPYSSAARKILQAVSRSVESCERLKGRKVLLDRYQIYQFEGVQLVPFDESLLAGGIRWRFTRPFQESLLDPEMQALRKWTKIGEEKKRLTGLYLRVCENELNGVRSTLIELLKSVSCRRPKGIRVPAAVAEVVNKPHFTEHLEKAAADLLTIASDLSLFSWTSRQSSKALFDSLIAVHADMQFLGTAFADENAAGKSLTYQKKGELTELKFKTFVVRQKGLLRSWAISHGPRVDRMVRTMSAVGWDIKEFVKRIEESFEDPVKFSAPHGKQVSVPYQPPRDASLNLLGKGL